MRLPCIFFTTLFLWTISKQAKSQTSRANHMFYKSANGALYSQIQMDSIIAQRNKRFQGLKTEIMVTTRQVQGDTAFLTYSFTITPIENEEIFDSVNTINREKLKTFLGKPLPPFTLKDINENQVISKELIGRPIVINFWFTSCSPCIAEMPEMNRIQAEYKNSDVIFLSMTYESKKTVQEFLRKRKFTYHHFVDAKEYIQQFTTLYPVTLFINRNGIVTGFMNGMPILTETSPQLKSHEVDTKEFLKLLNDIAR